jgi:hypothetical protein
MIKFVKILLEYMKECQMHRKKILLTGKLRYLAKIVREFCSKMFDIILKGILRDKTLNGLLDYK